MTFNKHSIIDLTNILLLPQQFKGEEILAYNALISGDLMRS